MPEGQSRRDSGESGGFCPGLLLEWLGFSRLKRVMAGPKDLFKKALSKVSGAPPTPSDKPTAGPTTVAKPTQPPPTLSEDSLIAQIEAEPHPTPVTAGPPGPSPFAGPPGPAPVAGPPPAAPPPAAP